MLLCSDLIKEADEADCSGEECYIPAIVEVLAISVDLALTMLLSLVKVMMIVEMPMLKITIKKKLA